jgi:hypothetical protein
MLAGIRTRDLRKIYTSPPPLASGGGFGFGAGSGKARNSPRQKLLRLVLRYFPSDNPFELSLSFPV